MPSEEMLLPCPFCGSTNIDASGWASTETSGPACDDCGGSAGSALQTREQNIAAWNRRTLPLSTDAPCPPQVRRIAYELRLCAQVFRDYERQHEHKALEAEDDPREAEDRRRKAKRNGDRAAVCEEVLAEFEQASALSTDAPEELRKLMASTPPWKDGPPIGPNPEPCTDAEMVELLRRAIIDAKDEDGDEVLKHHNWLSREAQATYLAKAAIAALPCVGKQIAENANCSAIREEDDVF